MTDAEQLAKLEVRTIAYDPNVRAAICCLLYAGQQTECTWPSNCAGIGLVDGKV